MNLPNFTMSDDQQANLQRVDQLVEMGVDRPTAQRLIDSFEAILTGPWADLIGSMKATNDADGVPDPEKSLIQTFFIAYLQAWVEDRIFIAGLSQGLIIHQLAERSNPSEPSA